MRAHAPSSQTPELPLTIGDPDDVLEIEADRVADSVAGITNVAAQPSFQNPFSNRSSGPDFSHIRVHTGTEAAQAAQAVNAAAFTIGHHIVFGLNRYAPRTNDGRHLLAHELAHCVQQQSMVPKLQRTLVVDPNQPTTLPISIAQPDPAAALTPAARFSTMDTLIQGLCDDFEVDSSTGEVVTKTRTSLDPAELVAGSKPAGCCCLNILTNAGNTWTIEVSQVVGPRTFFGSRQVVLNPTTTPVEFGAFTTAGTVAFQGAVPTAGHELCGHAALQEAGAHPSNQNRLTTDVHDPTVRIENQVSTEQRVPAAELRGLAASGPHRGESVDHITIQNYPLNATTVPASEQSKINFTAAYINQNDEFVDVLGHSDLSGSSSAKQFVSDQRAIGVRNALRAAGVPNTITSQGVGTVNRFTRVEGLSDTQPPPPALAANQNNWRRVDILMAGFPAGAQRPPLGTPAAVNPHVQNPNVPALKTSSDPCIAFLVSSAYP